VKKRSDGSVLDPEPAVPDLKSALRKKPKAQPKPKLIKRTRKIVSGESLHAALDDILQYNDS
jgi:hypothetical protein